jgi:predicted amidophosphoribosyltransferase
VGRREDVLRPPDREDAAFLSYCPRCQAQYTRSDGHCADCGGVQVQPFA